MIIKISQIDHTSNYLEDVIALGDANAGTLGLFPKQAFKESASKKHIIVAIDQDTEILAGYLLFNVSRRKMLVSIVHLCVDEVWRGNGIAKLLFDELKRITKDGYLSVRVRCRVDYDANAVWPKLDFVAMGEMKGRGKKETLLTIWKYEFAHPSLFSYAALQDESAKVKVVIDANVFFQLQNPDGFGHEESLSLLEPWLDVELYVTPEIYNEISRNQSEVIRKKSRKFADTFPIVDVKSSQAKFQQVYESLRALFPSKISPSDESDLRQLVYAISAGVPFFVTRDGPVLDKAEEVFEKYGIQILQPSDLVLMQDELLRGDDYAPSRVAGSQIRIEKVHSQQSEEIVEKFLFNQGETKAALNRRLQIALSQALTVETFIVRDSGNELVGLISFSRQFDGQMDILIFRVGKAPICNYVAKYLVNNIVLTASAEGRNAIILNDEYLSESIVSSLREGGFLRVSDSWLKITLHGILGKQEVVAKLSASCWPDFARETAGNMLSVLNSTPSQSVMLEIEKWLWPLKMRDVDIPTFIVPIRPEWAMHLFDVDIARQDLFGSEPSLILNAENVYYRSSAQKVLSAPGRILWYVSAGKKRYQGSMCIKACSYLDEVEIGTPKQLFSKYKKLGIYKWKDVYNGVAKGDVNKSIMAFKFSKTEILSRPIPLSQLKSLWKAEGKNFNNAQSPVFISKERFLEIYTLGMKG
jgi:predicted nucleic acid-binding protein/GNAT superfamily N-acetyltransferase